jgi:LysR family transcriptional regulator, nod-box dependent transcriptional activator
MQLTPRAESLAAQVSDILLRVDSALGVRPDFDPAMAQRHFNEVLRRIALLARG